MGSPRESDCCTPCRRWKGQLCGNNDATDAKLLTYEGQGRSSFLKEYWEYAYRTWTVCHDPWKTVYLVFESPNSSISNHIFNKKYVAEFFQL